MQEAAATTPSPGSATAIARVIVVIAAMTTIVTTWVLGVNDKEACSDAFGVTDVDGRTLTICNWVAWFTAIQILATLVALFVSLRDIRRHPTLRRIPLYLALFLVAFACYVAPSISFGFR